MSLVKTSLLKGIAVAVKVASALVLNKILAIYVCPAGYVIIGGAPGSHLHGAVATLRWTHMLPSLGQITFHT
jgi:hypothetical protein